MDAINQPHLPAPSIPMSIKGHVKNLVLDSNTEYWYPWLSTIKTTDTYVHLNAGWKLDGNYPDSPPNGYKNYIISGDSQMVGWAEHLRTRLDGNIIQLFQSFIPKNFQISQCNLLTYNTAHLRSRKLHLNLPAPDQKNIRFKASSLINRITQSKIIVFAALKELLPADDVVYSLHQSLRQPKNVHDWQLTGNTVCDYYTNLFRQSWQDISIKLTNDDGLGWNYNNPAYVESALNFTQESYHYSLVQQGDRVYIQPGPFVTEKTWKCLLSQTAFIPVGQYQTYTWLTSLGFKFDYGELNLGFDDDPGNLTRLEKIVGLIESLNKYSAIDIFEMTRESSVHNQKHILSQEFIGLCEQDNEKFYNFLQTLS